MSATPPVAAPQRPPANRLARPQRIIEAKQVFINIMVYGDPGVGKTMFAATGPGPVLFLDLDDGTTCLTNPNPQLVSALKIELNDLYEEKIRSLEKLKERVARIAMELRQEPGFWGTVVVDNLTELQRVLMDDILSSSGRTGGTPEHRDWGVLLRQIQTVVRAIKSLPCHTVFIAHEENKEAKIAPALSGRIQEELPGYVDIVARYVLTDVEKRDPTTGAVKMATVRKLRCRPQAGPPRVLAKDRSGRLDEWEDPHFGRMITKLTAR
jgi:phage nucleotide-binding protein